ncbi:MAG: fluoride efflux transporter CrcB [Bacteroidetes bacterium]|jgi:CrcB protein|nr:fluoride efflux transporter CrcB [Bacteroidota bacterium]
MSTVLLHCAYVGLGGFLGALARFGLAHFFSIYPHLPWGTLLANLVGSLLLGFLLLGALPHRVLSDSMRFFLAIGFCGSLTTMSTFSYEVIQMALQGQWLKNLAFFGLNIIGSLAMILAGRGLWRLMF